MDSKICSYIRATGTVLLVCFASLGGIHWLEHFGIASVFSSMLVVAFFGLVALSTRRHESEAPTLPGPNNGLQGMEGGS